jgi:external thioesterase TEII
MKKEKLIILIPFAGGSSYSFKGLCDELVGVDVLSLELPGRGKRIQENLLNNLDGIIKDLYDKSIEKIDEYEEYYIYGHSMGSLLGYLLIHKIISQGGKVPKHLFVSGRGGPSKAEKEDKTYLLPSKEFREKLKEMGGSPDEVLADEELMNFFEPILRSDFEVIETYQYEEKGLFDVPITSMFGNDEEVTHEEIQLWQQETTYSLTINEFPGNHFFIFKHWKEISDIINNVLNEVSELQS